MEELKNIYSYSKTEINKMKREDLLHLLYERDKNYFENVNGSEKDKLEVSITVVPAMVVSKSSRKAFTSDELLPLLATNILAFSLSFGLP